MRARLALPLLVLVALPASAMADLGAACLTEKDPAKLAAPADELAAFQAMDLDLSLAEPIPMLPFSQEAVDNHPCVGKLRPGAMLVITRIEGTFLCTANWVYQDQSGALYLGTAGHCVDKGSTIASPGVAEDIGEVAYSTGNGGVGRDFALIKIKPELYGFVTPTMCHWGGPQAISLDSDFAVVPAWPVVHYGWGATYGGTPVTRPRAGFIAGRELSQDSFTFQGTIAPGDSGSAIQLSSGRVLGVITHGLILPPPAPTLGLVLSLGTRVQHGLDLASRETGLSYSVVFSSVPVDLTGRNVP